MCEREAVCVSAFSSPFRVMYVVMYLAPFASLAHVPLQHPWMHYHVILLGKHFTCSTVPGTGKCWAYWLITGVWLCYVRSLLHHFSNLILDYFLWLQAICHMFVVWGCTYPHIQLSLLNIHSLSCLSSLSLLVLPLLPFTPCPFNLLPPLFFPFPAFLPLLCRSPSSLLLLFSPYPLNPILIPYPLPTFTLPLSPIASLLSLLSSSPSLPSLFLPDLLLPTYTHPPSSPLSLSSPYLTLPILASTPPPSTYLPIFTFSPFQNITDTERYMKEVLNISSVRTHIFPTRLPLEGLEALWVSTGKTHSLA